MSATRASKGAEDRCPHCGNPIAVTPRPTTAFNCSHCGQLIPKRSGRSGGRIRLLAASSGWIASLFVHLVGILTLTGITVGPTLVGGAPEVEIFLADDGIEEQIGTGAPELVMPLDQSRLVDLVELGVESTLEVAPLSLTQTDASQQMSALLTTEHHADASLGGVDADWGGLRTPSGGDQTSFFGLTALGGRFVYVIDSSASMRGLRFDSAKAEAIRSISSLSPKQEFHVIFYSDDFYPMPAENLVKATAQNLNTYINWIQAAKADGGTKPKDALLVALALSPDVIYFLSDGAFPPDAVEVVRDANQDRRVQVFTIAYYDRAGLELLKQIAQDNRGKCIYVAPDEAPEKTVR